MSRSGYIDDCENLGLWRGCVERAIRGKRGQQALRELANAMDAMPEKVLAADSLVNADGEFCTLGVLGQARGLNMAPLDPEDPDAVAAAFNIAPALAREIVYENDEALYPWDWVEVEVCGPLRRYDRRTISVRVDIDYELMARARWQHMRKWVADNLRVNAQNMENGMHELKTVTFDASQWQLVPKAPTEDMVWKAEEDAPKFHHGDPWYGSDPVSDAQVRAVYTAMLAAAPTPAAQSALRDDQIRDLVNQLRDTAIQFRDAEQLRARIAGIIVPVLKSAAQSAGQEVDGWETVRVKNLQPLLDALERAERKGYLPDAFESEWAALEVDYAAPVNGGERERHRDDAAVDVFAQAMKAKMADARAKGRGGWEVCDPANLSRALREHVEKGDPRDVANFCMMLWHHSKPISAADALQVGGDALDELYHIAREKSKREWLDVARAALSAPAKVGGDELRLPDALPAAYLSTEPNKWDRCTINKKGTFTVPVYTAQQVRDAFDVGRATLSANSGDRKDAERYRWLRDVSVPPHNFYISVPVEFHGVRYTRAEVDAAIDAAIASKTVGGDAK